VLLIAKPELKGGQDTQIVARRVGELLTDPGLQLACRLALETEGARLDVAAWLEKTPADIRDAIARALMDGRFDRVPDAPRALADLVKRLETGRRERMLEQYKLAMEEAIRQGDEIAKRELFARQMDLIRTKHGVQVPAEAVKTR